MGPVWNWCLHGQQIPDRQVLADELEQWTFWHRPEVGYHQTLKQKEITSSLLFGDGM